MTIKRAPSKATKSPATSPEIFSKGANAVTTIPANPIPVPRIVINLTHFHRIKLIKITIIDPEQTKSKTCAKDVSCKLNVPAQKCKPSHIPLSITQCHDCRHIAMQSDLRFFQSRILINAQMTVVI